MQAVNRGATEDALGSSTRATSSSSTTAAPSRPSKPRFGDLTPVPQERGDTFVGPLARRLGIRPATLRKWERAGLVQPRRDPQTGYRIYSAADVRDAQLAHQLRRGGYLLEQIAPLIAQVRSAGGVAPLESMLRDWQPASRPGAAPCSPAPPPWTPTSTADRTPPPNRPQERPTRSASPAKRSADPRPACDIAAAQTVITATYPDARRKVAMIKESAPVCPFFGGDFSPGGEYSVYMTAKSPPSENSARS